MSSKSTRAALCDSQNQTQQLLHELDKARQDVRVSAERTKGSLEELKSARLLIDTHERELIKASSALESTRILLQDSQNQTQKLLGEVDQARQDVRVAAAELARKESLIEQKSDELHHTKVELAVQHERLSTHMQRMAAIDLELVNTHGELSSARREITFLKTTSSENEQSIERLSNELRLRDSKVEALVQENANLNSELSSTKEKLTGYEKELSETRNQVRLEREANISLKETIAIQARALTRPEKANAISMAQYVSQAAERLRKWRKRRESIERWELEAIKKSKLFDALWYLQQNPDVADADQDPLEHYILYGWREGRNPHPLFDQQWYLTRYRVVATSGMTPLAHYITIGAWECMNPHPLFDTGWYLRQYPEVAENHQNPLFHFMQYGASERRDPHPLFLTEWYLSHNPDVAAAGENPLYHFMLHGAAERRSPHPLFDADWYIAQQPDSAEVSQNSLIHYLSKGARQGLSPSPLFDSEWYIERNKDIGAHNENPLVHFVIEGSKHRRNPHPLFDTAWYCENSPKAAKWPGGPFAHYLSVGGFEGRSPHPLFDSAWYTESNPEVKSAAITPLEHYLRHHHESHGEPHRLFRLEYVKSKYGLKFQDGVAPLVAFVKMSQVRDLDPSALFNSILYRYQVEVERSRLLNDPPIIDYLKNGYSDKLVLPNIIFDPKAYLELNEIQISGPELVHYVSEGDRSGYFTHPHFCAEVYNSLRHDSIGETAVEHFLRSDPSNQLVSHKQLTRPLSQDVISFIRRAIEPKGFDRDFYTDLYSDISDSNDAKLHYEEFGRDEGRFGSGYEMLRRENIRVRDIPLSFYWDEYLQLNTDLKGKIDARFGPLFLHFMLHGREENRMYGFWQLYIDVQKYIISAPRSPLSVPPSRTMAGVCVLIHVFHTDIFPELIAYARSFEGLLSGVFINVANSTWSLPFQRQIRDLCPGAFTLVSPNTGRDIGGFLRLLANLEIQNYELFAFMHTKMSPHIAREKGDYWRRRLLNAFAGNTEIAEGCVRLFRENPDIGVIASEEWRATDIGNNLEQYEMLLDRFGIEPEYRDVEYVSGTMFMVRREIVQRIYECLKDVEFESGDGATLESNIDGQIAHAAERVIGSVVRQMGYRFEWVDA